MAHRHFLSLLLILLSLCSQLRGDELKLRSGGRVRGELISREHGRLTFRSPAGISVFQERDVLAVVRGPSPWKRYAEKRKQLVGRDLRGHLALARWCKKEGLRKEGKAELLEVLKIDPDQGDARKMRREMKVHGIWLPEKVARKVLGQVRYQGRWRDGREVARERRARKERTRRLSLQRKVNSLLRRLVRRSSKTRDRAHKDLLRLAKAEGLPELSSYVAKLRDAADVYWRSVAVGLVEVRAQQAQLVRLRRRSVSLGTGSPVTLELPEIRRVSIGTTVGVPLGFR